MKRLVIMAIYSPDAQLEGYKKQLINGIRQYADSLYVVCNCEMSESAYIFLRQKSDQLMIRGNVGFDAGAYKDAISVASIDDYDETLLMNDTFYGFFYPLDEFFNKVKDTEETDFWGLTKHPKGENELGSFEEHIQSYFLLIKSKMLHSKAFKEFWNGLSYPFSRLEAIKNFEIRFTSYFESKGFKGAVFCDLNTIGIECKYNQNPYVHYPFELIQLLRCPILKVKPYPSIHKFYRTKKILDHIKLSSDYEVNFIYKNFEKTFKKNTEDPFNFIELEKFYKIYQRIFIYGHGAVAKNISAYFEYKGWDFEGFVVSKKTDDNEKVIEYKHMKFEKTDGIVIALGRKQLNEVYSMLKEDVSDDQLLLPQY